MRKYGQDGFFHLTYVELKHQRGEHNQVCANDFQCLIWIFWVCRLSRAWYNVDCSQLMSLFDRFHFSWSTWHCGASSSDKSPAHNSANHFWHVRSVIAPSLYTAQIIFWVSVVFFLTLETLFWVRQGKHGWKYYRVKEGWGNQCNFFFLCGRMSSPNDELKPLQDYYLYLRQCKKRGFNQKACIWH